MKDVRRLTIFCLLAGVVVLVALSFWYDLGGHALFDNNDGIYALIARQKMGCACSVVARSWWLTAI